MEYLYRRGDAPTRLEAFKMAVVIGMGFHEGRPIYTFDEAADDWDNVCYNLGLPFDDAPKLAAMYATLMELKPD